LKFSLFSFYYFSIAFLILVGNCQFLSYDMVKI
jgi:hypothetical protein